MSEVPLRDHIEAILAEKQQGVVVAEQERAKTQHVAEQEREKAAQARRQDIDHRIMEVDRHLRQHISTQIDQVNADRIAATKLLEAGIEALRREALLIHNASETAIKKAEEQNLAWRAQANEWRGQSADRERTQEDQLAKLAATFLPREVADAQATELRQQVANVTGRMDRIQGATIQEQRHEQHSQPWQIWIAGAFLSFFIMLIVVGVGAFT